MERFPDWLKKTWPLSGASRQLDSLLKALDLYSVCKSACCPNRGECFSQKRVTFMILGNMCTRDCRFCSVKKSTTLQAGKIDTGEPKRVSEAVEILGLRHAIITSVTRDDLDDGGAGQFRKTVELIKHKSANITVEVLTPDFNGKTEPLDSVLSSAIDIFGHNIETVPRLYSSARPQADYKRSLGIIERAARKLSKVKSGIMVGLGETKEEVCETMRDLREAGCGLLTIGQYLRPSSSQLAVREYVHPEIFDLYREEALSLGFNRVLSEPFARTSYMGTDYEN